MAGYPLRTISNNSKPNPNSILSDGGSHAAGSPFIRKHKSYRICYSSLCSQRMMANLKYQVTVSDLNWQLSMIYANARGGVRRGRFWTIEATYTHNQYSISILKYTEILL